MVLLNMSLYEIVGFIIFCYSVFLVSSNVNKFIFKNFDEYFILGFITIYLVWAAVVIYCWPLLIISLVHTLKNNK